jgi:hypothetical protein
VLGPRDGLRCVHAVASGEGFGIGHALSCEDAGRVAIILPRAGWGFSGQDRVHQTHPVSPPVGYAATLPFGEGFGTGRTLFFSKLRRAVLR